MNPSVPGAVDDETTKLPPPEGRQGREEPKTAKPEKAAKPAKAEKPARQRKQPEASAEAGFPKQRRGDRDVEPGARARELTASAADAPSGGMHALGNALRYEWARLRTLRSTWCLLAAAVAVNALVAMVASLQITSGDLDLAPEGVVAVVTGGAGFSPLAPAAVLIGVCGVLALGHEYRHGLARTTLCALPRRGTVLVAKALVVTVFAAVTAALAAAVAFGVGVAVVGEDWTLSLLSGGDVRRAIGGFVALAVLTALLGLALAGLLRNLTAALAVLLLTPMAVEPLAEVLLRSDGMGEFADAGAYLPFTAGQSMVSVSADAGHAYVPLSALAGGLVLLGYVVLALGLAAILLKARDA